MALPSVPLRGIYASGSDALFDFYEACLKNSNRYDRAAGYFSSSLYVAAQLALSDFAARRGRIRLVCSPHLVRDDFEAMERGLSLRAAVSERLTSEISDLVTQPEARPGVDFLATLIAENNLEIRIAYGEEASPGLFHSKVGVFTDESGSSIAFIGSANETWSAWSDLGNHESFAAFGTWTNAVDAGRAADIAAYFEALWSGMQPGVAVREIPDAPRQYLMDRANRSGLSAAQRELLDTLTNTRPATSTAKAKRLLPHQRAVLRSWKERGHRGVIDHVTGAGKTITALAAMRYWLEMDRPVLVLVPRELLQIQWRDEIRRELSDVAPSILLAGGIGDRPTWLHGLSDQTRAGSLLGRRVTIAIDDTAATPDFLRRCKAGPHLLVIGDEAHNYGSKNNLGLLDALSATEARLGLSATLERAGDVAGTLALRAFFGESIPPEFGIRDAIAANRLVPYRYALATVELLPNEEEEYSRLTDEVRKAAGREGAEGGEPSEYLKMLLIKRARILKKAALKAQVATEIVTSEYRDGQHWLLYCDDREQMAQLIDQLEAAGLRPLEYHSAMTAQAATLRAFVELGGLLVAIRCLDEGVDLPVLDHAVILASSTNPREYVQRRGRVLRWQDHKPMAYIYDLVVTDHDSIPISINEVERARTFARDAYNREALLDVSELYRRGVEAGRFDADTEQDPEEGVEDVG